MRKTTRKTSRQSGLAIIEFTIVATVLFLALFGIMELSRFVFSLQMLNEVTRKAARIATVCEVTEAKNIPSLPSITSIAPSDYEADMLKIDYLDEDGISVFSGVGSITNDDFLRIKFVRAKIEGYSYAFSLLTSVLGESVSTPSFETIIPAESLGVYRPNSDGSVPVSPSCS